VLPIAGSNTTPRRVIAYAKWKNREPNSPPVAYGIEFPENTIGQIAWLICQDIPPEKHDKTLIVYENFSAELEINDSVTLEFPPNPYKISEGEQHRFE